MRFIFFNISGKKKGKALFLLIAVGISLVTNHKIFIKWEVVYRGQKFHCKEQWMLCDIHMGSEKSVFKNAFSCKINKC